MSPAPIKRCAIYTRKSSDEGLDQAFNSLHAQREACEAYVKSQGGEGWRASEVAYDDGGISGGTMERPALQRLLTDVGAGRVDTIVVYKVDRLTRSLADFAKMVELFDSKAVSFVSVTQAFNTTTSMGRLTLNVLLSFAQFEREVTGERIRDKLAASKAKGMWMGGLPPLGYAPDPTPGARTLVVVPDEAATVRRIFQRYLELGSVNLLARELAAAGVVSKAWTTKKGRCLGGLPFSRGALFHLLRNPIFVGRIVHRDLSYPGLHPAIIEQRLYEAVRARLTAGATQRASRLTRVSTAPLRGLLFDATGGPMTPTFTRASGRDRINRYYVSTSATSRDEAKSSTALLTRVPAEAIEDFVFERIRQICAPEAATPGWLELKPAVRRVELTYSTVAIEIDVAQVPPTYDQPVLTIEAMSSRLSGSDRLEPTPCQPSLFKLVSTTRLKRRGGRTSTTLSSMPAMAMKARVDAALIKALRRAHGFKRQLGLGERAAKEAASPETQYEQRLLALAFLAPDLQADILAGRQPVGLTLQAMIMNPTPLAWADQRAHLVELAERA